MRIWKNIGYLLLGVILAFVITFAVIGIASLINKLSVGEQITQWFGSLGTKTTDVIDTVTKK